MSVTVDIPEKLEPILNSISTFNVLYGGRGGCKSWIIARYLLFQAMQRKVRVLCCREIQASMAQSVHQLLVDQINLLELPGFTITDKAITHQNGSKFTFKGLRININNTKSFEGANLVWVEEANSVSEESWNVLLPTILRTTGARFYITFNPENETDPTYQRFVINPPPNTLIIKTTYQDNPWLSPEMSQAIEHDKKTDYDRYRWVWEGECKKISDSQVFGGKYTVQVFDTPDDAEFLFGADWGFATDPTTLIRSFIETKNGERVLYIDKELYGFGIETVQLPTFFQRLPDSQKHPIRGDSARPEIISHLQKNGYPLLKGARKWSGSIEDGISYLRGFDKIIIHERCVHTIEEFKLYSYKRNRLTLEVTAVLEDKNNHCIDALRYAHEPLMIKPPVYSGSGFSDRSLNFEIR